MQKIKKVVKAVFLISMIFSAVAFSAVYIMGQSISENYKITRGDTLKIDSYIPVTAEYNGAKMSQMNTHNVGDVFEVDLKIFGLIPFSTAQVEVVDEMYVSVLGNPFGMKIYTDGVLVIELSDVDTVSGNVNPAKKAGIEVGDYIISVNGHKITCNEDLSDIVSKSNGEIMNFKVLHNGKTCNCKVSPQKSVETGTYRIGIWVRDSSAGIGTLTFYSPASGVICGLGHGICDSDTGGLLTLESGELVGAQIVSVAKGSDGNPGELKGKFTFDSIANIALNAENGVYGLYKGKNDVSNLTEIALKQEVTDGEAQILCTVDGDTPKLYSCTVKKRNSTYFSATQNLTVTVTDKELIEKTGGIVQGMSGSPVLQNGRLIGAITHVLVDDPTTGYAIFAENMLETAQSVANENKLKDAS